MGKRTDLDVPTLIKAYQSGESASSMARRLDCSVWSIITRLRKAGVNMRTSDKQNARWLGDRGTPVDKGFVFQVLEGLLLGDGYLDPKGSLRLEQTQVRVGWLDLLTVQLAEHGCESTIIPIPPKIRECEGRTIRGKGGRLLYTPCYKEFKAQRQRWYPEGVKVVPGDLVLTPLSVAQWFCGDGVASRDGTLDFCTDGFSFGCVGLLSERLRKDLGVYTTVRPTHRGQPKLYVDRKEDALKLVEAVKPWLPECCQYKTLYVGHCKPNPHWERSRKLTPDDVRTIRREVREGTSTQVSLAKQFGVFTGTIYNVVHGKTYRHVV